MKNMWISYNQEKKSISLPCTKVSDSLNVKLHLPTTILIRLHQGMGSMNYRISTHKALYWNKLFRQTYPLINSKISLTQLCPWHKHWKKQRVDVRNVIQNSKLILSTFVT